MLVWATWRFFCGLLVWFVNRLGGTCLDYVEDEVEVLGGFKDEIYGASFVEVVDAADYIGAHHFAWVEELWLEVILWIRVG